MRRHCWHRRQNVRHMYTCMNGRKTCTYFKCVYIGIIVINAKNVNIVYLSLSFLLFSPHVRLYLWTRDGKKEREKDLISICRIRYVFEKSTKRTIEFFCIRPLHSSIKYHTQFSLNFKYRFRFQFHIPYIRKTKCRQTQCDVNTKNHVHVCIVSVLAWKLQHCQH